MLLPATVGVAGARRAPTRTTPARSSLPCARWCCRACGCGRRGRPQPVAVRAARCEYEYQGLRLWAPRAP